MLKHKFKVNSATTYLISSPVSQNEIRASAIAPGSLAKLAQIRRARAVVQQPGAGLQSKTGGRSLAKRQSVFGTDPRALVSKGSLFARLFLEHVNDYFVFRVHDHEIIVNHRVIVWPQFRIIGCRIARHRLNLHAARHEGADLGLKARSALIGRLLTQVVPDGPSLRFRQDNGIGTVLRRGRRRCRRLRSATRGRLRTSLRYRQ